MFEISSAEARKSFSELLNNAAYAKRRTIITKSGKPAAAIVPIEDLEMIEKIEDYIDIKEADKILKSNDEWIPAEEVKKMFNL